MKAKKIAAYVLTMGMTFSCLSGCGNSEGGQKPLADPNNTTGFQ